MKEAEKINQLEDIQINFEPAKVAFSDFGAFEAGIEQAVAKYSTFDLEVNTIKEVKQARTDLNRLNKSLEDRRKEIKNKINEPYAKFKTTYDIPHKKLEALIDKLKKQIDDYEDNQKNLRKDAVRNWFKQKAIEGNLNPEIFEQYLDNFTKETQFKKDSFQLLKKTEAELEAIVITSCRIKTRKIKTYQSSVASVRLITSGQLLISERMKVVRRLQKCLIASLRILKAPSYSKSVKKHENEQRQNVRQKLSALPRSKQKQASRPMMQKLARLSKMKQNQSQQATSMLLLLNSGLISNKPRNSRNGSM